MVIKDALLQFKMARGLIILSIVTFILGTLGAGFSLYIIIEEGKLYQPNRTYNIKKDYPHVFHVNLETKIIDIVTGILLILSGLKMVFSILLFIGIRRNISGFVLAYFSYGSMLLIIVFLTGLLEFIQGYWYLGVITILISGVYVYCLNVVYTQYDVIQKGIVFGITGHTLLINEEQAILTTEQT